MSQHSPTTFTLLSVDRAMRNAPFPNGRDGAPSPSVSSALACQAVVAQREGWRLPLPVIPLDLPSYPFE